MSVDTSCSSAVLIRVGGLPLSVVHLRLAVPDAAIADEASDG